MSPYSSYRRPPPPSSSQPPGLGMGIFSVVMSALGFVICGPLGPIIGILSGLHTAKNARYYDKSARVLGWIGVGLGAVSLIVSLITLILAWTGHERSDVPPERREAADSQRAVSVRELVRASSLRTQDCFESWAASSSEARAGLSISAIVEVRTDEDGAVSEAQVSGEHVTPELATCLETQVRGWSFPVGWYFFEIPYQVPGPES